MSKAIQANVLSPALVEKLGKQRRYHSQLVTEENLALATYYGGELLYPFIRSFSPHEKQEKLNERKRETVYHHEDFVKEISRRYTETIFSGREVKRVTGVPELDAWLQDDYSDFFISDVAEQSYYLPEFYVHVSNRSEIEFPSLQSFYEGWGWGKPSVVLGSQVHNVILDDSRQPCYISFKQTETDGYEKVNRLIIYDELYVYKYEADTLTFIESYEHTCLGVPFVRVCWQDNKAMGNIGHAYLTDAIHKSIAMLQYISMFFESTSIHLFGTKLVATEEDSKKIKATGLGSTEIIEVGSSPDTTKPYYLSIPTGEVDKMIEIIWERIPESIYRSARLRYKSSTDNASGRAKFIDMQPELRAVSRVAKQLRNVDKKICELIFSTINTATVRFEGDGYMFPSTFDVKTTGEYLEELTIIATNLTGTSLPQSVTALRTLLIKLYTEMFRDTNPELIATITEEINKWDIPTIVAEVKNPVKLMENKNPTLP